MHGLLTKLLFKRNIKDVTKLSQEESVQFENWNKILSKDELTIADIKEFCQYQISIIENKWADYNIDQNKKNELLPYFTVYKCILSAINSPKAARESLEMQLNQLINQ